MTTKKNPLDAVKSNLIDDDEANMATKAKPARVRIMLEDSREIPPTGQFFGAQGEGMILRPGVEADVPMSIINILDTAVTSEPLLDNNDRVIGYRDKRRFPYRVIVGEQRVS